MLDAQIESAGRQMRTANGGRIQGWAEIGDSLRRTLDLVVLAETEHLVAGDQDYAFCSPPDPLQQDRDIALLREIQLA